VASPQYCTSNALVAIVGPTGAGKSEWALRIAEHLDGEIVNCDSMQIYRGFDIGTAKPSLADRRGIPHHLFDIAQATDIFSAGDYARLARKAIEEISGRRRFPIIVGGTGFYLRALLDGLPDLPPRNECLRQRLAQRSLHQRYRMLQRLDARAAGRLHVNDEARVMRAIEIRLLSGKPVPEPGVGGGLPGFQVRKICLLPPREALYQKLNHRTEQMYKRGLVDEVRGLLSAGVPPSAKAFEAVGYRQALAVARGEMDEPAAVLATQQATRNYAKRQLTWFRHERDLEVLPRFGNE